MKRTIDYQLQSNSKYLLMDSNLLFVVTCVNANAGTGSG